MALLERARNLRPAPHAIAWVSLIAVVGALASWQAVLSTHSTPGSKTARHRTSARAENAPAAAPVIAQAANLVPSIEVVIGQRDTLERIFRRLSFSLTDLASIRGLPGVRQALDRLRPGDSIRFGFVGNDVHTLSRQVSETQRLEVLRESSGFSATFVDHPVQTQVRTATGRIDSSLFQASDQAGLSDATAMQLANIFGWDIDFVLDLRTGDAFTVVYEQVFRHGDYLRDGEIIAAEFVNAGRTYRAVRFAGADGSAAYYSPQGLPLRKAFLRAPVEFTRVSSRFNPARRHPILNLIRGHMGTDYAAPMGTPVYAASDGRISFKGRKGGYGNALVLAHANDVSTLYGHLSRFAAREAIGSHVHQGQLIGYVGMSGLATGPHLHYEFLRHGVHKDPEKVQLPVALPLQGALLERFAAAAAPLLARLDDPERSVEPRERLRLAAH